MDSSAELRTVLVVSLGACLALTRRAWALPSRRCPPSPLIEGLPDPGPNAFILMVALLAVAPVSGAVLALWFCAADWTRFRPWLYQLGAMLLALEICPDALDVCRLITVCVYVWAGLLKLNGCFFRVIYPWFVAPLPSRIRPFALRLGYAAPVIETSIGLGLVLPALRPLALIGATAMHAFILCCCATRRQREIWPWNLGMAVINPLLFVGAPATFGYHPWTLLLFGALPALAFFGLDPVLSHAHMSGRHRFGFLTLSPRLMERLPADLCSHCSPVAGAWVLDLGGWYQAELGVPPPQRLGMLQRIARDFRRYGAGPGELSLTVLGMPKTTAIAYPTRTYAWHELSGRS